MADDTLVWQFDGKGNMGSFINKMTKALEDMGVRATKVEGKTVKALEHSGAAAAKALPNFNKLNLTLAETPGKLEVIERHANSLRESLRKATTIDEFTRLNKELYVTEQRLKNLHNLGRPQVGPTINTTMPGRGMANFQNFAGQLGGLGGFATMGGYAAAGYAAYKLVDFSNQAANGYLDYDQLIGKSNVTARLNPYKRAQLKRELLGINYINGPITDIPMAYADAISKTNDDRLARELVKTSAKGSRAGFAGIFEVESFLASTANILKNQGVRNINTNEILDEAIKGQRLGAVEFNQLAKDFPGLLALSPKGTNYKDVLGSYSYLTSVLPAEQANTDLQNLLAAFGKKQTIDLFDKEYGKSKNPMYKDGIPVGFVNTLDAVYKRYKEFERLSPEKAEKFLSRIIPDTQAKIALTNILADFDKYRSFIKDMQNATGETDLALKFSINEKDIQSQADRAWEIFKMQWGEKVAAPVKLTIAEGFINLFGDEQAKYTMQLARNEGAFNSLYNKGFKPENFKLNTDPFGGDFSGEANGYETSITSGQYEAYKKYYYTKAFTKNTASVDTFLQKNPFLYDTWRYENSRPGLGMFDLKDFKNNNNNDPTNPNLPDITDTISRAPQVKNINITINKLAGIENLTTTTTAEAMPQMEENALNSLMRVLNEASKMAN